MRDVGRDGLKGRDDEYWRAVVGMEGFSGGNSGNGGPDAGPVERAEVGVWEEEEVMEAIARVTNLGRDGLATAGERGVDVERVGREAALFVDSVTRGLGDG